MAFDSIEPGSIYDVPQVWNEWLGRYMPDPDYMEALAEQLEMEPHDLYTWYWTARLSP